MSPMIMTLGSITPLLVYLTIGWASGEPHLGQTRADPAPGTVSTGAVLVVETPERHSATVESAVFWLRIRNTSRDVIAVDKQLTFSKNVFFHLVSASGTTYESPGIASGVPRDPMILKAGQQRRYGPFDLAKLDVLDTSTGLAELRRIKLDPGVYELVVTYESHDAAAERKGIEEKGIRVPVRLRSEKRELRIAAPS